mgnify:CR=1 FL=1
MVGYQARIKNIGWYWTGKYEYKTHTGNNDQRLKLSWNDVYL